MAKVRLLVLLAGCAVAGAACGGSSSGSSAPPTATAAPKPGSNVVAVTMRNIKFHPHRVVVKVGQTVRWTNRDSVVHTVASSKLRVASEGIGPGKTFSYTPKKPGVYPYFCTIHANQTGVLVVQ